MSQSEATPGDTLLTVEGLRVAFPGRDGGWTEAVRGVSFAWVASGWVSWANPVPASRRPGAPSSA